MCYMCWNVLHVLQYYFVTCATILLHHIMKIDKLHRQSLTINIWHALTQETRTNQDIRFGLPDCSLIIIEQKCGTCHRRRILINV